MVRARSRARLGLRRPARATGALAACCAAGAAILAMAGGGCNIVGPAVIIAKGPPKFDAQYAIEPDRDTVIFVDDRENVLPRRALVEVIGRTAESTLLAEKAIDEERMISARSATLAARQDRFGSPLSIVEIGRAVDAEQVIYVAFDEFELSTDRVSLVPSATVRLKVIDVESGERLWPEEFEGHEVTISMPQQQGSMPSDRTSRLQMQEALAAYVGRGIAQVFYKHKVTESNLE